MGDSGDSVVIGPTRYDYTSRPYVGGCADIDQVGPNYNMFDDDLPQRILAANQMLAEARGYYQQSWRRLLPVLHKNVFAFPPETPMWTQENFWNAARLAQSMLEFEVELLDQRWR